jgi:hypothetical protein
LDVLDAEDCQADPGQRIAPAAKIATLSPQMSKRQTRGGDGVGRLGTGPQPEPAVERFLRFGTSAALPERKSSLPLLASESLSVKGVEE